MGRELEAAERVVWERGRPGAAKPREGKREYLDKESRCLLLEATAKKLINYVGFFFFFFLNCRKYPLVFFFLINIFILSKVGYLI